MTYMFRMPMRPITVAETRVFLRQVESLWSEAERLEFVDFIATNPEGGDIIPDTGGVRKIRWSRQGRGERGGVRVVYYYYDEATPFYLLMIYAKSVKEDLNPGEKKMVMELTAILKQNARS